MNAALRTKAITLRTKERLSYAEIKKRLKVSKSTLSYWLHDHPLREEEILFLRRRAWKKGEASRERFRNTMREKKKANAEKVYGEQKRRLATLPEDAFFVAGLMLHLGEGDKRNGTRINLANTDPEIIKFFIKWLDNFLGIAREKIRIQLHLYENMDIAGEVKFWKKELCLEDSQLYKTQIRRLQKSSFTYAGSYRHGTCSIFVPGVKRKTELMMATKALLDICKEVKTMRA
ncbi:MAG: hypothetical protein Q7S52_05880 [bacterium]|nr:hypothetical protein [bacterium]